MAAFYGIQPSPVDDTVWGQTMDVGFSGADQPGYSSTYSRRQSFGDRACRNFLPPEGELGLRGIDVDLKGVVWTVLGSGIWRDSI